MRIAVAAILLGLLCTTGTAQREPEALILTSRDADGTLVWNLPHASLIQTEDVVRLYAESTGRRVQYDPKKITGNVFSIGPVAGQQLRGQQIDEFVQKILGDSKLVLTGIASGTCTIVPATDASQLARSVSVEELESANPAEWVNCVYVCRHASANYIRAVMQYIASRSGSGINPIQGNVLLISDQVPRVREILALVKAADIPSQTDPVVRRYNLAGEMQPATAKVVIEQLFPTVEGAKTTVDVAVVPGSPAILVRAIGSDHEQVAKALELLK